MSRLQRVSVLIMTLFLNVRMTGTLLSGTIDSQLDRIPSIPEARTPITAMALPVLPDELNYSNLGRTALEKATQMSTVFAQRNKFIAPSASDG